MQKPDDHNPFDAPQSDAHNGASDIDKQITRRELVFAAVFATVVLGGVISWQRARFSRLNAAARKAQQRARARRKREKQTANQDSDQPGHNQGTMTDNDQKHPTP